MAVLKVDNLVALMGENLVDQMAVELVAMIAA
jgi:hypothetical protein